MIGVAENDDITALVQAFSEQYSDVQPIIRYLQKGDASYSPAREWIRHGYAPDVVYNVDFGPENAEYLEDLALWGYNHLMIWVDKHHFNGPDDPALIQFVDRVKKLYVLGAEIGRAHV